jgi:hypothetical protein
MKNILILCFLTLLIKHSFAQHFKDPSYSVHNYKHPNKAAEAREKNYDHLQHFEYANEETPSHRNYKAQNHPVTGGGGILPTAPTEKNINSIHSRRNYKRQF